MASIDSIIDSEVEKNMEVEGECVGAEEMTAQVVALQTQLDELRWYIGLENIFDTHKFSNFSIAPLKVIALSIMATATFFAHKFYIYSSLSPLV